MRHLILLRHASALAGADDRARPLGAAGEREALAAGRALAALEARGLRATCALVSGARRTQETWRLAAGALAAPPRPESEAGLYLASATALLLRLRGVADEHGCVVVVGHNPGLSELAHDLVGRRDGAARARAARGLSPGAGVLLRFAIERWDELAPGRSEHAEWLDAGR